MAPSCKHTKTDLEPPFVDHFPRVSPWFAPFCRCWPKGFHRVRRGAFGGALSAEPLGLAALFMGQQRDDGGGGCSGTQWPAERRGEERCGGWVRYLCWVDRMVIDFGWFWNFDIYIYIIIIYRWYMSKDMIVWHICMVCNGVVWDVMLCHRCYLMLCSAIFRISCLRVIISCQPCSFKNIHHLLGVELPPAQCSELICCWLGSALGAVLILFFSWQLPNRIKTESYRVKKSKPNRKSSSNDEMESMESN